MVLLQTFALAALVLLLPAVLAADERIAPAPAFTAAELSRPRDDGWLTNGGTLSNQRYSPLTQINRHNVQGVKALGMSARFRGVPAQQWRSPWSTTA
jgi:glucose dehydrogenase